MKTNRIEFPSMVRREAVVPQAGSERARCGALVTVKARNAQPSKVKRASYNRTAMEIGVALLCGIAIAGSASAFLREPTPAVAPETATIVSNVHSPGGGRIHHFPILFRSRLRTWT
jgi:hypothetical protein